MASACTRALLLATLFALQASFSHGQGKFAVTFPCTVHPGTEAVITVSLFGVSADVNVRAELQSLGGNSLSATSAVVAAAGSPAQVRIQTPSSIAVGSQLTLSVHGSGGLTFSNSTKLSVGNSFSLFVQTDRGAYRPGQTVRMRIVSVLPTLRPYAGTFDVTISDPSRNRLVQWLAVRPTNGIWSEEFPISDYPPLGNWTVNVTASTAKTGAAFEVREYVLPKFSVTVTPLPYIVRGESSEIYAFITAQYTYGKAVQGTAKVELSLNNVYQYCSGHYQSGKKIMRQVTLTADKNATVSLTRAEFMGLFCSASNFKTYFRGSQQLLVNVSVTDLLSGETRHSSAAVGLFGVAEQLKFDSSVTQSSFKPGARYPVRLLYSTPDKKPIDGATITLEITGSTLKTAAKTTLTTRHGVINYVYSVPRGTHYLRMTAYPGTSRQNLDYNRQAHQHPSRAESPSDSYLQLTAAKANYAAGETAVFTATATVNASSLFTQLVYSVYSRSKLVHQGSATPIAKAASVTFSVVTTPAMGPYAKVLAYFVVRGELVVDSLSVSVDGVFDNNVTMAFDAASARPNDNVTLTVSAVAGSTVAISVVDQSALLVRQANTITADGVAAELASYDQSGRPVSYGGPVWALREPAIFRRRRRRTVLPGPWYYGGSNAASVLSNAGVCVITNLNVPRSRFMWAFDSGPVNFGIAEASPKSRSGSGGSPAGSAVGQSLAVPDHTRDFFPETWLWSTGVASAGGEARFQATVPDTITSWVASAFAVSSSRGMGVAPSPVKLRAFQPFFISLVLPYSVVRGEELVLQVNVFNYMDVAQRTVVSLQATASLAVTGASAGQAATKTITIAAGSAQSARFVINPTAAGRVPLTVTAQSGVAADRVVRQLLVEPEGVTKSYSHGVFISLSAGGSTQTESVPLMLPAENVVPGSARAVVSVVGDIMGPALANLDSLLKMPYGCGEQNMLAFAPDVFITRYLTATKQSSAAILSKARRFMLSGYQRELRYWRTDYSFSAFGNRDKEGSLWLTAFVVKSFSQAVPYIYVDPDVISKSLQFILGRQSSSGAFRAVGMVHHRALKGGLQGDVALAAYILTAMVEARNAQTLPAKGLVDAIGATKAYVGRQVTLVTFAAMDNYTLALSAYALQLAKSPVAAQALSELLARGERTGGTLRWRDARQKTVSARRWRPYNRASAADVELTAYGLLALIQAKGLVDASAVARWLAAQRNSYGGFASTQDTVVGMQALAEFATLVAASPPAMTVRIGGSGDGVVPFSQSFAVNAANSLVLQQTTDFPVPATLALTATGTGTAVLSVEVFYNLRVDDVTAFKMSAACSLWKKGELLGATCKYCTRVASDTYANTGMSLLEVGLPSGFSADSDSVSRAMASEPLVGRVETPDRRVVFYLDEVGTMDTCLSFDILQNLVVGNLQASALRTINYYNPSVSNADLYNVSAQVIPLCCQCETCDGCSDGVPALPCPVLGARPATGAAPPTGAVSFAAVLAAAIATVLLL